MRARVLAAILLVPLAGAQSPASRVDLSGPSEVDAGASPVTVTIDVGLALDDILCAEDSTFVVTLDASASNADARLSASSASFVVPAGAMSWSGSDAVGLTVAAANASAEGLVEVSAVLTGGPCGASDARATLDVRVPAAPPPPPPSAPPQPADTRVPPGAGYIGEYQQPQESKRAPGPPTGLVLAGAACAAAILARRRLRS